MTLCLLIIICLALLILQQVAEVNANITKKERNFGLSDEGYGMTDYEVEQRKKEQAKTKAIAKEAKIAKKATARKAYWKLLKKNLKKDLIPFTKLKF